MRALRGRGHAFPFPGDGAATLESAPHYGHNGTGFRLVNANDSNDFQVYWGNDGRVSSARARTIDRSEIHPLSKAGVLGIRLCVDWREE